MDKIKNDLSEDYSFKRVSQEGEKDWNDVLKRFIKELVKRGCKTSEEDLNWLLLNYYALPNSPALVTAGTDIFSASACSSYPVYDTLFDHRFSIMGSVGIASKALKAGIGVGFNFSQIRSKEELVKGAAEVAEGPVGVLKQYSGFINGISQLKRKPACMGLLHVNHPDVEDFIDVKVEDEKIDNFNLSLILDDKFMEAVDAGNEYYSPYKHSPNGNKSGEWIDADKLFDKMALRAWENGEPGFMFQDTIERDYFEDMKERILANPCVTGETLLRSPEGDFNIRELVESGRREIPVYCCDSQTGETKIRMGRNPRKTQTNQKIYKVTIHRGKRGKSTIRVTGNHGFITLDGKRIETLELKRMLEGGKKNTKHHGIQIKSFSKYEYNGESFIGYNGGEYKEHQIVAEWKYSRKPNWGENVHHLDHNHLNNHPDNIVYRDNREHASYHSKGENNPRYKANITEEQKKRELISKNTPFYCVRCSKRVNKTQFDRYRLCTDCEETFLEIFEKDNSYTQVMKKTIKRAMNIATELNINNEITEDNWDLLVEKYGSSKVSLNTILKYLESWEEFENCFNNFNSRVISVEEDGCEDVYNITVDEFHTVAWNDLITFNCSEALLSWGEDWLELCVLATINGPRYEELKKEDRERVCNITTSMLNDIIDLQDYICEEHRVGMKDRNRKIGIGIAGLATIFAKNGWEYASDEAFEYTKSIFREIGELSTKKSSELGNVNNLGRYNSSIMSQAPTSTLSRVFDYYNEEGCSFGIEPYFSLEEITVNNSFGTFTMKEKIIDYLDGKIDHIKCANELSYKEHLRPLEAYYQANQKGITQGCSKTINFRNNVSVEEVKKAIFYCWKKGIKAVSFYRDGSRKNQTISTEGTYKESIERPKTIKYQDAPKRPDELSCDIYRLQSRNQRWVVFVGLLEGEVYEVFMGEEERIKIPVKYEHGILRKSRGKYCLVLGEGDEELIISDLPSLFESREFSTLSRLISMSLRHGVPLKYCAEQLLKDGAFDAINRAVARVLKKYIKENEEVNRPCPECGNSLIYISGCPTCTKCNWSRCG